MSESSPRDVLDYRETGAQPVIEVSTVENAEGADWFDLHIAVSIENEVVPFEELFVALSQRQDYLILNTGVYFSSIGQSLISCEISSKRRARCRIVTGQP